MKDDKNIKIIGVGGGGANMIHKIHDENMEDVELIGKWISREIMDQYSARAWIYRVMYDYQYVKEVRRLGEELRCEYGIEEIEAINSEQYGLLIS